MSVSEYSARVAELEAKVTAGERFSFEDGLFCDEHVDLLTLGEAMKKLGADAEKIQPLFITVDPERDTKELLADYVTSFHPRLLGLTGSDAEVAVAVRAYKVHRVKYTPANDPKTYGVDHSSLTYLMGPDGKFRTLIPHNTSAERMAEIVRPYLAQG